MSKYPEWQKEELDKLKELLDVHASYGEISKILHRSINGIKLSMYRKLHYEPKCLDCGVIIKGRKGNRIRCPECSTKNTTIKKKIYAKDNNILFRNMKNERRFGGNRQKVLERDKYTCQNCGKTHHEILLDVHHIDKSGRNKNKHNHSMENLITLCHSCHTKQHKEDTIMKRWHPDGR
jgi:DNA-directed RNA polymerase subunit RPC12/RpoP